jgi:hypothetical protein
MNSTKMPAVLSNPFHDTSNLVKEDWNTAGHGRHTTVNELGG